MRDVTLVIFSYIEYLVILSYIEFIKNKVSHKEAFKDLLTPFWLVSAMPALMTTTNINSIVFGECNSQITSF